MKGGRHVAAHVNVLSLIPTGGFEQKPGSPLGFVDPVFKQARGGDVLVLVANRVHRGCHLLVVIK